MRGKLTDTRRLMEVITRSGAHVTFVSIVTCVSIAWAADVAAQNTLTLSGQRRTVACEGDTLRITGQRNTVTVTGECRKVDISGASNTIAIEAVAAIEVTGTNNKVTWGRALNGDNPRVSSTGTNTITRAVASDASSAPAPVPSARSAPPTPAKPDREPAPPAAGPVPPPPASGSGAPARAKTERATGTRRGVTPPSETEAVVTLLEDGREDAIDCRGRDVSILGSRNTLHLRGSCPLVIVTGSDNVLDVDNAQRIRATGDRNRVVWTSVIDGATTPRVENTGQQNRISKADRKPVSP
jgi:hypothetical protein